MRSLNSSKGYPLEATKSKRTWSLQLPRKRLSRNSPLGVRIRSLLICSAESSSGSGGRACSNDKRIACKKEFEKNTVFCSVQHIDHCGYTSITGEKSRFLLFKGPVCRVWGGGGAQMETNKGGFHFSKSDKQLL